MCKSEQTEAVGIANLEGHSWDFSPYGVSSSAVDIQLITKTSDPLHFSGFKVDIWEVVSLLCVRADRALYNLNPKLSDALVMQNRYIMSV